MQLIVIKRAVSLARNRHLINTLGVPCLTLTCILTLQSLHFVVIAIEYSLHQVDSWGQPESEMPEVANRSF